MRTLALVLIAIVCLGLQACAGQHAVQAGNDEVAGAHPASVPTLTGELMKVDLENDMITVQTPTGMEQTFRLDPSVTIDGVPSPPASKSKAKTHIRKLRGKEGEIVSVEWEEQAGPKLAMSIDLEKESGEAADEKK